VFPVAGLGPVFLPATKASPKEMLNVVDKPLIQYAVEEAIAAGITEMIFVTGRSKRAIEDHFDKPYSRRSWFAYEYDGVRYDCGSKLGYLKASVEFALRHPKVSTEFATYLQSQPLDSVGSRLV